jgi:hypothetical protein
MSNLFPWERLLQEFTAQREYCRGYSPLYLALFSYTTEILYKYAVHEDLDFAEKAFITLLESAWQDRPDFTIAGSSLLLAAAIHAAILNDDPQTEGISRFYATVGGSYTPEYDRDVFEQALGGLFLNPGPTLPHFLKNHTIQTNEVSRGALWLLFAILQGRLGSQVPIALVDLGCSAGLNLAADVQGWCWRTRDGMLQLGADAPLVTQTLITEGADPWLRSALAPGQVQPPDIARRVGLDRAPRDLNNPQDYLLLRACQWGDQPERLARFEQAATAAKRVTREIRTADIVEAASKLHKVITPDTRLLIMYNSAVTVYLQDQAFAALHTGIETAFKALPPQVKGVWLELEAPRCGDPGLPSGKYAMKLRSLHDDRLRMQYMAICEPHPQTITFLPGWTLTL